MGRILASFEPVAAGRERASCCSLAREALFEPYRGGSGEAAGGSGLGLAIVRELVELHGGGVTIGDAPEGGALLAVELPRAPGLPCASGRATACRA